MSLESDASRLARSRGPGHHSALGNELDLHHPLGRDQDLANALREVEGLGGGVKIAVAGFEQGVHSGSPGLEVDHDTRHGPDPFYAGWPEEVISDADHLLGYFEEPHVVKHAIGAKG